MPIIDRYIITEWLKIFLLACLVLLGLLLLEDMNDDLPDYLNGGASSQAILSYYFVLTPSFLPNVLPLALLLSLLFSLGNLHRNNEIAAMRAAGLNILRITRSLIVVGIIFTVLLFYLNASLVPWSLEQSNRWRKRLTHAVAMQTAAADNVGIEYHFTFANPNDHRIWFMNRFSQQTYRGFGVNVYQLTPSGQEAFRILAREAHYDDADNQWIMTTGRVLSFDTDTGEAIRSQAFTERAFPQLQESPQIMEMLGKSPRDLSLVELNSILANDHHQSPQLQALRVRYQTILANPFSCLIIVLLAIPFATRGIRITPLVGMSKCIVLFFFYYAIANIFLLLGNQAVISAVAAAWIPNICLLVYTLFLYRRAL